VGYSSVKSTHKSYINWWEEAKESYGFVKVSYEERNSSAFLLQPVYASSEGVDNKPQYGVTFECSMKQLYIDLQPSDNQFGA